MCHYRQDIRYHDKHHCECIRLDHHMAQLQSDWHEFESRMHLLTIFFFKKKIDFKKIDKKNLRHMQMQRKVDSLADNRYPIDTIFCVKK